MFWQSIHVTCASIVWKPINIYFIVYQHILSRPPSVPILLHTSGNSQYNSQKEGDSPTILSSHSVLSSVTIATCYLFYYIWPSQRKKANKTFLIMGYLILFSVNHSRPALGCSMTTGKWGSLAHISRIVKGCQGSFQLAGHVNDFLHTKHLVVKALRFLKQSFHNKNNIDGSQMEVPW